MQTEQLIAARPFYQDYSAARKAEVLALVDAANGNVLQVARDTGIAHQTIRYWLADESRYSEFKNEKRVELTEKLDFTAHLLVDSITSEKIADASLSQIATAAGIMIDKSQLLKGLPTSISESVERQELTVLLSDALSEAIDITPEK